MRLFKNIPYKLETVVLDDDGKYISGLSVNYQVKKCSDDSIIDSGEMFEINSVYTKEIILTEIGEYRVKYTTPENYENGFENIIVDDYDNYKINISELALDATVAKEATLIDKSSQSSVDSIKSDTESIITALSTLVVDIWGYTARTLTSFGTLVSDVTLAVWSYTTRTITAGGITASEIWTYITRTLTSGTKDAEIDVIKTTTETIKTNIGIPHSLDLITDIENIQLTINEIKPLVERCLGLSMENYRIFSPIYDTNNCLTSATIKIYPTKTDCIVDTNSIAIYSMVSTFDSEGKCLSYRMTHES